MNLLFRMLKNCLAALKGAATSIGNLNLYQVFLIGCFLLGLGVLGLYMIPAEFKVAWFITLFATMIGMLIVMQMLVSLLLLMFSMDQNDDTKS